jgi:site-specific recombinase XerD
MYPFFYQFLVDLKGLSTNSVLAYRDAIKLLLSFAADFIKKAVCELNTCDLDDKLIFHFLDHLEIERNCSIQTRNARLAAIRAFFDFISREEPELLLHCQKIRSIPLKRTEHKSLCYLENDELKAILDSVDVNSRNGLRDKALFIFLYNTGARVQETIDVKIEDLKLDVPGKVKLVGKGKKERACPLWPETIDAVKDYLKQREPDNPDEKRVFLNTNGKSITRFGIRYIIKKYTENASQKCPSLNNKKVGPPYLNYNWTSTKLKTSYFSSYYCYTFN